MSSHSSGYTYIVLFQQASNRCFIDTCFSLAVPYGNTYPRSCVSAQGLAGKSCSGLLHFCVAVVVVVAPFYFAAKKKTSLSCSEELLLEDTHPICCLPCACSLPGTRDLLGTATNHHNQLLRPA